MQIYQELWEMLLGLGVSFFGNSRIPSDFYLGILDLAWEFQIFARFSGASPIAFYKGYALKPLGILNLSQEF